MRVGDERGPDRSLVRVVDPSVAVDIVGLGVVVGVDHARPDDVAFPRTDAHLVRRNFGETSGGDQIHVAPGIASRREVVWGVERPEVDAVDVDAAIEQRVVAVNQLHEPDVRLAAQLLEIREVPTTG